MNIKNFQKILGQYPKVVREDEIYFPVSSIEKAFEEYIKSLKLKIPFSDEDLQDLQNGKTFDWCFEGVDVHLYNSEEDKTDNKDTLYFCAKCQNSFKFEDLNSLEQEELLNNKGFVCSDCINNEMDRETFIQIMYDTDYIFDDLQFREFAQEHFQNGLSFEENTKNFFKWVGEDE